MHRVNSKQIEKRTAKSEKCTAESGRGKSAQGQKQAEGKVHNQSRQSEKRTRPKAGRAKSAQAKSRQSVKCTKPKAGRGTSQKQAEGKAHKPKQSGKAHKPRQSGRVHNRRQREQRARPKADKGKSAQAKAGRG